MSNIYPASINDCDSVRGDSTSYQIKRKLTNISYDPPRKLTRIKDNVQIDNLVVEDVVIENLEVETLDVVTLNATTADVVTLTADDATMDVLNATEETVDILTVNDTFQGVDADYFTGITSNIQEQLDALSNVELSWKQVCAIHTTANLNLSAPGSIQGLNQSSSPSIAGARVLVMNQTTTSQNGIYIYNTATTPMVRSSDANTASELQWAAVALGSIDPTQPGYIYRESLAITTIGVDPVAFVNISTGVPLDSIAPISIGNIPSNNLPIRIGAISGSTQGQQSIAIGFTAGNNQNTQCIAIGPLSGQIQSPGAIAMGSGAGFSSQGNHSIALGQECGSTQGNDCVAIGYQAGQSQVSNSIILNATSAPLNSAVAGFIAAPIRTTAGTTPVNLQYDTTNKEIICSNAVDLTALDPISIGNSSSNTDPIKIGSSAGASQSTQSIAIGKSSGAVQSTDCIAIGTSSGASQSAGAIAIGLSAGTATQNTGAIAIGSGAGSGSSQNAGAIAIGRNAASNLSQGTSAIAIGDTATASTQSANTIIINATGTAISNNQPGTCIIAPIRQTAGTTPVNLSYDTTRKEIIASSSADYLTLANVGSSPNSAGASISGTTLTLQPADASNPGLISTGAQDIPGTKTFKSGTINITPAAGVITISSDTAATTTNLFNAANTTTLNMGGAATTVSIGASTGTTTVNNDLDLASGKVYKINNTQITTTALSDTTAKNTTTANTAGAIVQSMTITYTKIQNMVTLSIPLFGFTTTATGLITFQLPTLSPSIFPATTILMTVALNTGTSPSWSGSNALIQIDTSGLITWYRVLSSKLTFPSGIAYELPGTALSYIT